MRLPSSHLPLFVMMMVMVLLFLHTSDATTDTTDVKFFTCPLYTLPLNHTVYTSFQTLHPNFDLTAQSAQCAIIPLPKNPSDPHSERIPIFIKRIPVSQNSKPLQNRILWLLPGISPTYSINYNNQSQDNQTESFFLDSLSPASASSIFSEPLMDRLVKLFTLYNMPFDYIYTMDHRGVGRSGRLGCESVQAETVGSPSSVFIDSDRELPLCENSHQDFSSVNAAIDLASVISMLNQSRVFLYGNAYGTVWITRLMRHVELSGKKLDIKGVVMDGVMSTVVTDEDDNRFTYDQTIQYQNEAVVNYLQYCNRVENGTMNACQEKLQHVMTTQGQTAISLLDSTIDLIYRNQTLCNPMLNIIQSEDVFRQIMTRLMFNQYERVFIPAIIYRLNRCDMDLDVPTLQKMFSTWLKRRGDNQEAYVKFHTLQSPMLGYNIVFSELWNGNATLPSIQQAYSSATIATRDALSYKNALDRSKWQVYEISDEYSRVAFSTDVPVLLLNGQLDALTPVQGARKHARDIGGNSHRLIEIPNGAHFSLINSPIENSTVDCGLQLFLNFIGMDDVNVTAIDTSCLNHLSFNFTGSPVVNREIAGVLDIYEDLYDPEVTSPVIGMFLTIGIVSTTAVICVVTIVLLAYALCDLRFKLRNNRVYERIIQE